LGNAVLAARQFVEGEPIALILPDDIDPAKTCLSDMIRIFADLRQTLIAVNSSRNGCHNVEMRYYGVASLGQPLEVPGLYCVAEVVEKPKEHPVVLNSTKRQIMGRYVLAPEIMTALELIDPNPSTKKYELTDALSDFVAERRVYAYQPHHDLLPLAPVRSLIDEAIASIANRPKLQRIVELVQKLANDVEST
jgi:UTP--glucose-1-phosphate uridylyltransferase